MALIRAGSELQAANGALAHIGEASLSSLEENRASARIIKRHFGAERDALLRRHDWNFALRWATPARDTAAPAGTFANMYPLPGDCIRVRLVDGASDSDWCIENGGTTGEDGEASLVSMLSTSLASPRIGYTALIADPSLWDATFLAAFEFALAAKIAPQLGRDDALANDMRLNAERIVLRAKQQDLREAARSRIPLPSYITSRWA